MRSENLRKPCFLHRMVAGPHATRVFKPGLYCAQGTGSCKCHGTGSCFTMYRAQDRAIPVAKDSRGPVGHFFDSMHRAQDSKVPRRFSIPWTWHRIYNSWHFLIHYAQGTGSCKPSPTTRVNLMHRAEDSLVPLGHSPEPCTGHRIQEFLPVFPTYVQGTGFMTVVTPRLCTGQWFHEFRLVISSISCTGHSFLKFRAGFYIFLSRNFTTVVILLFIIHRAQDASREFRLVILLILCTGHSFLQFIAGFLFFFCQ